MIQSINSNSSYLTLHSNNKLLKKLAEESNTQTKVTSLDETALNGTESEDSNNVTSTGKATLSMGDLMGMLHHYMKPKMAASTSSDEDTEAADDTSTTEETEATLLDQSQETGKSQTTTNSTLGSIDADGDGTISEDEYNKLISQLGIKDALSAKDFFSEFDTDGDGEITSTEMDAKRPMGPPPQKLETQVSNIDTDGDGTISTDEYESLLSQLNVSNALSSEDFFKEYDTNSDGEISLDEIESAQSNLNQNQSKNYGKLAANTLNAYENNYEYTFGSESTNTSNIA
ncbi:EF-hand domain-containing protein [Anaeromicropila herbilytica]|uniref:EF-hand domain-containing protein n=1 Tax=Anaeromicropila herbilytica TaxID=2785025 RepID=A0A7R7EIH5_9FIRM|nr:EF-hand domain-containing protein [Anaeromicropila herbilytica]BCN29397.1 hypothetical protein bsdtb5_06920 [Anaeromicropila herbilytica]